MDSAAGKKEYTRLANELLDKKNPGTYNQAIMDFGATVCKPQAPLCNGCIFQKNCAAYYNNDVGALPLKEKKIRQQIRYFYFFLLEHNNMIAIHERTNKDIWRHLHEFALIEKEQATNIETIIDEAIKKGWLNSATEVKNMSSTYTQKLTHQRVYGIFITAALQRKPSGVGDYDWVKINTLRSLAFPKLLNSFLVKEYLCD